MAHIKVSNGLDIPLSGKPSGAVRKLPSPKRVALNLAPFSDVKFKILVKEGPVKLGQVIAECKTHPEIKFVAPAGGVVTEVKRGLKRRLLDVIIETSKKEAVVKHKTLDPENASKEEILSMLCKSGLFPKIRMRPFNLMAIPTDTPKSIFVKAVNSAPYQPPAEMHVREHSREFQVGLNALTKLTSGKVHLVYRKDCDFDGFTEAVNVDHHTVEGPHPVGNVSVHIHNIDPITHHSDRVWTVTAMDVVAMGHLFITGHYFTDRLIALGGNALLPGKTGYYMGREGYPINELLQGSNDNVPLRVISGDPLMGEAVDFDEFLGFNHDTVSVIPENSQREMLHFFRLGTDKFTSHKAYLSGLMDHSTNEFEFTTNQHGEHRAFVDSTIYEKVMPMQIPTQQLIKALITKNYDEAEALGFLEVVAEDLALATFIDPCKNEMTEIVKVAIADYSKEVIC